MIFLLRSRLKNTGQALLEKASGLVRLKVKKDSSYCCKKMVAYFKNVLQITI